MKSIPHVLIAYNRFLDPIFISFVKNDPRWTGIEIPTPEVVTDRVRAYNAIWDRYGTDILAGMCDILDLSFTRNAIDVYVVSVNPRPFSNPVVIKSGYEPREFITVLTHELIHRLFTLNGHLVKQELFSDFFPSEPKATQNHIFVHAVLSYIYLEVLNDPDLLRLNKERSAAHSTGEYLRAWKIVDEHGYKELISKLVSAYTKGPA